jgi:hypothetical protein
VERAKALKVNAGTEPDADLGPVISKQVRPHFHVCYLPQLTNFGDKWVENAITFHYLFCITYGNCSFSLWVAAYWHFLFCMSLCWLFQTVDYLSILPFTGKGTNTQINSKWCWKWCQTTAWREEYSGTVWYFNVLLSLSVAMIVLFMVCMNYLCGVLNSGWYACAVQEAASFLKILSRNCSESSDWMSRNYSDF